MLIHRVSKVYQHLIKLKYKAFYSAKFKILQNSPNRKGSVNDGAALNLFGKKIEVLVRNENTAANDIAPAHSHPRCAL